MEVIKTDIEVAIEKWNNIYKIYEESNMVNQDLNANLKLKINY
mgnify:CR=1 FL=1